MEAVRGAVAADVATLAELARRAIAELAVLRGGSVWQVDEARREPLEDVFSDLVASGDGVRVVVGTIDEHILGYGVAQVRTLADGSRLGVIEDIFVESQARGVGLGEGLVGDLVGWCDDQGCRGVDAMALPGQRETKNFFEGSGFTARKLVMHRSLAHPHPA